MIGIVQIVFAVIEGLITIIKMLHQKATKAVSSISPSPSTGQYITVSAVTKANTNIKPQEVTEDKEHPDPYKDGKHTEEQDLKDLDRIANEG